MYIVYYSCRATIY